MAEVFSAPGRTIKIGGTTAEFCRSFKYLDLKRHGSETPVRLHRRVTEAKREVPLIALRNATLIAVTYDTLLRRSELVSLYVEDLQKGPDGSGTVLVRRSKTDQEGEGAIKYLAPDAMAHIDGWLSAARLAAGFELLEVMQAGSWKTPAMPARYGERLRAQRGAARTLATLQNRA